MLLIPLRKACKNPTEVVALVSQIFNDIKDERRLKNFEVTKEMHRGIKDAIVDAVVLQPKIGPLGFDFHKFFDRIRQR
jgi:hypothetical protein